MEKVEMPKNPEFKPNVHITALFTRHAQYDKTGLTREGYEEASQFGDTLDLEAVIKSYAGPMPRLELTATTIVESSQAEKKLMQRPREHLSGDSIFDAEKSLYLKELLQDLGNTKKLPKEEQEAAANKIREEFVDKWIVCHDQRPDEGTKAPLEIARNMAHMLKRYIDMPKKNIKSGSNITLVNVCNEPMIAVFLRYLLRQEKAGTVEEGQELYTNRKPIRYLDTVAFDIRTDQNGKRSVSALFRGEQYDISDLQPFLKE